MDPWFATGAGIVLALTVVIIVRKILRAITRAVRRVLGGISNWFEPE